MNHMQYVEASERDDSPGALVELADPDGPLQTAREYLYDLASGNGGVPVSTFHRQYQHVHPNPDDIVEDTRKFALDVDCALWARCDIVHWEWPLSLLRIELPGMTLLDQLQLFQQFLDENVCCIDPEFGGVIHEMVGIDEFLSMGLPIIHKFGKHSPATNMPLERALKRVLTSCVRRSLVSFCVVYDVSCKAMGYGPSSSRGGQVAQNTIWGHQNRRV